MLLAHLYINAIYRNRKISIASSFYQAVFVPDRKCVLSALFQSYPLFLHQLLFLAHKLQMLLFEVMRKIFQNPPVLHQVKSFGSTVWVPKLVTGYHSRQVLMKSVKSQSGSSRADERVLEEGAAFFSWGFSTFYLSKNTCHLLAFYLRYPKEYEHHVLRRHSKHLNNETHLFVLILPSEKRVTHMQLSNNASKTPNIDFSVIGKTKDDLRSTVISALDVSVNGLSFKATRTKINNFNS